MSVLLQIIATGAQLVLAADNVPELKYEQSCRSATRAAAMPDRNEDSCLQDERAAKQKLSEGVEGLHAGAALALRAALPLWRIPELCRAADLHGDEQGFRQPAGQREPHSTDRSLRR